MWLIKSYFNNTPSNIEDSYAPKEVDISWETALVSALPKLLLVQFKCHSLKLLL